MMYKYNLGILYKSILLIGFSYMGTSWYAKSGEDSIILLYRKMVNQGADEGAIISMLTERSIKTSPEQKVIWDEMISVYKLILEEKNEKAIQALKHLLKNDRQDIVGDELNSFIMRLQGRLLIQKEDYSGALDVYEFVINKFGSNDNEIVRENVAVSLFNKCQLLSELNSDDDAVRCGVKHLMTYIDSSSDIERKTVVDTLDLLEYYCNQTSRIEREEINIAIKLCDQAFKYQSFKRAEDWYLSKLMRARVNFRLFIKDIDGAVRSINEYISVFTGSKEPNIRVVLADMMLKRIMLIQARQINDGDSELIDHINAIIDEFSGDSDSSIVNAVLTALLEKGRLLLNQNKCVEALIIFREIIDNHRSSTNADTRDIVFTSLDIVRGILVKDYDGCCFDDATGEMKAIDENIRVALDIDPLNHETAVLLFKKAELYRHRGHLAAALSTLNALLSSYSNVDGLDEIIAKAMLNKAKLFSLLGGIHGRKEAIAVICELIERFQENTQPDINDVIQEARTLAKRLSE